MTGSYKHYDGYEYLESTIGKHISEFTATTDQPSAINWDTFYPVIDEDGIIYDCVDAKEPDDSLETVDWKDGKIVRGFATFTRNCMVCHTMNLGGDATIGPDLNVPYNPTEYLRADALRRLIRDPQSLRHWPATKMPPFSVATLSDRDYNDVLAYLQHMAGRKVALPASK